MSTLYYESSFAHHGIRGQKWGVRRFQNPDGTLTSKGIKRYYSKDRPGLMKKVSSDVKSNYKTGKFNSDEMSKAINSYKDATSEIRKFKTNKKVYDEYSKKASKMLAEKEYMSKYNRRPTKKEYSDWYDYYKNGGGNNGEGWKLYCKDKGLNSDSINKKISSATDKVFNSSKNIADKMISDYSKTNVNDTYSRLPNNIKDSIRRNAANVIESEIVNDLYNDHYGYDD